MIELNISQCACCHWIVHSFLYKSNFDPSELRYSFWCCIQLIGAIWDIEPNVRCPKLPRYGESWASTRCKLEQSLKSWLKIINIYWPLLQTLDAPWSRLTQTFSPQQVVGEKTHQFSQTCCFPLPCCD